LGGASFKAFRPFLGMIHNIYHSLDVKHYTTARHYSPLNDSKILVWEGSTLLDNLDSAFIDSLQLDGDFVTL
jgi:hypothetical protein